MKLDVPYYSQFVDIQDPFWMLRACGGVSLAMVSKFHGVQIDSLLSLCEEALTRGGYDMENGWIHDYLVTKAKEFGLEAYRKEGLIDVQEIIASLDAGNPVIVSVEKRVLEQKRFHLITLVGYDAERLYYHEPESTDKEKGKFRSCDVSTFMQYFRGKAIFISKKR